MTVDAVLVLQRSDVARVAAQAARHAGTKLLFVDPGLLDEAVTQGITGCEFRRLELGADFQARAAAEALARATLVDLQLSAERERLWGGAGDLPLTGWDVGLFFLALQRAAVGRALGQAVARSFPEGRIGLLRPSAVQQMYFDSFLLTELAGQDPARFVVVDHYDEVRWQRPAAYEQVFDAEAIRKLLAQGVVSLVTHVPTCFYDRAWLAAEVARAHAYTIDLPSPFWDVPLHRGRALLRPLAELPVDAGVERAERYRERAERVLDGLLGDLLPHADSRRRQIAAWAARCRWQALNFEALRSAFAGHRPAFLLADQDTGHNGPLFSLAALLGSEITVVPHSGHASMLMPHARRVRAVERAGYGCAPRTVLGQSVAVRAVRWNQRAARRAPERMQRLKRVCLLLNSMQTEGLSHVDAHALAAFYKPLAALCEARDVDLILRPKPGAPALSVLAAALGLPADRLVGAVNQPLEHLAEACELCLAWGEPTTGIAPFLDAGSLVLQACAQRWPTDYLVCMPLVRDGVVPLLGPAEALAEVHALLAAPPTLATRAAAQSRAFDARAAGAHEHLFDLRPPP